MSADGSYNLGIVDHFPVTGNRDAGDDTDNCHHDQEFDQAVAAELLRRHIFGTRPSSAVKSGFPALLPPPPVFIA